MTRYGAQGAVHMLLFQPAAPGSYQACLVVYPGKRAGPSPADPANHEREVISACAMLLAQGQI